MGRKQQRTSSMRTLFEVRAHRRTWRVVIAVALGAVSYWLTLHHVLQR